MSLYRAGLRSRMLTAALAGLLVASARHPQLDAQDRRIIRTAPVTQDAAPQGRRVALVIGNDAYTDAPLKNAKNDAAAMAAALEELGFTVTRVTDARRDVFGARLATFSESIRTDDLAFFFFAGHGVQVEGENYLLPIDTGIASPMAVRLNGIGANQVVAALQRAVSVVILDACRNNPFLGGRSSGGGLAQMEARGSLIAFSTGNNQVASDNSAQANGLFTGELIRVLREPGLSLREVFFRARQRVYERSSGAQFPAVYDGLLGDLQLRAAAADSASAVSPPRIAAPTATVPASPALGSARRSAYVVLQRLANESKPGQASTARVNAATAAERPALQEKMQSDFQKLLEPVLNDYSRSQQIGMIFNGPDAGLVWANSSLDVSAEIIRRLNGAPAPAPSQNIPDSRVAYLVLQKIANESADGRVATSQIQALQQRKAPQAEVQALQTSLQDEFQKRLEPILSAYAAQQRLGFIFNGPDAGLVWADARADISADVIRWLDLASGGSRTVSQAQIVVPESRTAYIVLQKAANESVRGRAATAQINALKARKASQAEIDTLQQSLQAEFQKSLEPLLQKLGNERGLTFIFNGPDAGLVYANEPLDVTDELIRLLDARK